MEEANYQYAIFFQQIKNEVNSKQDKDMGLINWAKQVQQTIAEVKKLSSHAKRSHSLHVGVSSRLGAKPVLSEIDAENNRIRSKQLQEFLLRKSDKAFDPRTFYHNESYVYVVPHTHTDLGWLKTMKDYYEQGTLLSPDVHKILDSMLKTLHKPGRKYVFHDVGFLKLFWANLAATQKELVQQYVKKGKLEIANCGISMNDVLLPDHHEILYNFNNGRKWCKSNLGKVSKTSWFLDPFGFSRAHARLLEDMGFKNLVINRINYKDKAQRRRDSRLIFHWKTKDHTRGLRTAVLPFHYNGSSFSVVYGKWIYDDPTLRTFNLFHRYSRMIEDFEQQKQIYKSNVFFDLYGDDFSHADFELTVGAYEKLMAFNNYNPQRNSGFHIKFATISEFFDDLTEVNKMKKRSHLVPSENPNFVPYIDAANSYWTGFYTTRPELKSSITRCIATYRSILGLSTLSLNRGNSNRTQSRLEAEDIPVFNEFLQNTIGILLHHDAITSTSNLLTVVDYLKMVKQANTEMMLHLKSVSLLDKVLEHRLGLTQANFSDFFFCNSADLRMCLLNGLDQRRTVIGVFFNPGYSRLHIENIVLPDANVELLDEKNQRVDNFIVCYPILRPNAAITTSRSCRMYFQIPMARGETRILKYTKVASRESALFSPNIEINGCRQFKLNDNTLIRVNCSVTPEELKIINQKGEELSLSVQLKEYLTRDSGPYIFRPAFGSRQSPKTAENEVLRGVTVVQSSMMFEVRYYYNEASVLVKFFKQDQTKLDAFKIVVEVIKKNKNLRHEDTRVYTGREWVVEFQTNWINNKNFYYSQNGLDLDFSDLPRFGRFVNDFNDDYDLGQCKL